MVGELTMFKTNTPMSQNEFKNLLIESLNWESFEQQALWVLVFAHKSVKPESWGVVIPYLNEEIHFGLGKFFIGYLASFQRRFQQFRTISLDVMSTNHPGS